MIRYIQIEDSNKIDAEITFKSVKKGNQIYMALENGEKPLNKRVLKSTKENSLDFLIGKKTPTDDDYIEFSERLINKDDEIDFEFGMANCINLSVEDCLTIGGNFIFNENNINESGRVKGIMDQSEPVRLFFMNSEEKKAANIFLDKRLNSIKDVFIKYDLDINAFHFITNNIYK